jgi:hypothetical protein
MKNTLLSKLLIIFAAVNLSACGGGGSSSGSSTTDYYGSIYVNTQNGGAAIVANYTSQNAADTAALNSCISTSRTNSCIKAVDFGTAQCGALARSVNTTYSGKFGTGTSSAAEIAQANALSKCVTNGGTNCQILLSLCNDNGKSNNSLFGLVTQSDADLVAIKNGEMTEQGGALDAGWLASPSGENSN